VVVGTHPIPQKNYLTHIKMGSWNSKEWEILIKPALATKEIRLAFD
jgi:hypothetical protein